ncbi:putative transcription factor GRAS family [Helianthus annuus]|nr:putative transcription factor GRAS family [Helianthus annuus]KAJ0480347.1 putative transcription factor GRAS family [Helianthus annuus]KAJ0497040.1 putative transcription factor GRAS family [Helianthus annuus]
MIAQQDRLESFMKVMKSSNPHVMVASEVTANLNSPNFVNRLFDGLFHYGALFDSLEDCLGREDENRTITKSMYFGTGIKNILASENTERVIKHVKIDVWRKFFAWFGMKEIKLSMSSLYQANLVAEKFSYGSCCTFDRDGDSLIIG